MLNKKNIIYFLVVFFIGYCSNSMLTSPPSSINKENATSSKESPSNPSNAKKKERKILYWQAPMDPSYIRDKPGKSPMGMDLIPVYADEVSSDNNSIKVSPTLEHNFAVITDKVIRDCLKRTIKIYGELDYNEKLIKHIHSKFSGWVEKLNIDFIGAKVNKGDTLYQVYSPELVATQEELILAIRYFNQMKNTSFNSAFKGAKDILTATRERLRFFDINPSQIKLIEETKKTRKLLKITSPVEGYVIEKKIQEGMRINPGTNLYTIADISSLWAFGFIYEEDLPFVELGDKATINIKGYPGKKFQATLSYIDPYVKEKNRTIKVRFNLDNKKELLKPKMYADISLEKILYNNAILVPQIAVIHYGNKDMVIVKEKKGTYSPREITLGELGDGYYRVVKGLKEGEEVVTSSQFLFDSEANLKEEINRMLNVNKKNN